jgi:AraC-like DNA-binding protein
VQEQNDAVCVKGGIRRAWPSWEGSSMKNAGSNPSDERIARIKSELARQRSALNQAEQQSAMLRRRTLELYRELKRVTGHSESPVRAITNPSSSSGTTSDHKNITSDAHQLKFGPVGKRRNESPRAGLPIGRLKRVIAHIKTHLDEPATVKSLAAIVNMSPSHFACLFKRSTGISPHEYILRHRVAKATQLLADEGLSIAEIGWRLGFSSQAHFTTVFRTRMGITPSAYRRRDDRNGHDLRLSADSERRPSKVERPKSRHRHDGDGEFAVRDLPVS